MLGLPDGVTALLFDLDGVLTQTAKVHQAAWKEMFDDFLRERDGDGFEEFTKPTTSATWTASRATTACARSWSRAGSTRTRQLVRTLGDRKNDAVQKKIREDGVEVYEGSRRYLEAARDAGTAARRGVLLAPTPRRCSR